MIDFVAQYGILATVAFGLVALVAYLFHRKCRKAMPVLGDDKETIKVERHYSLHFSIERPCINEEKIQKESEQNPSSSRSIDPSLIKTKCPNCGSEESRSDGKYYSSNVGLTLRRRCKNCGKSYKYNPVNQTVLQPARDGFIDRCKHFDDLPHLFTIAEYQNFFSKLGLPITLNIAYQDFRRLRELNKLTRPSTGLWEKVKATQEKTELLSKPLSKIDKSDISTVCPKCGSSEFRGVNVSNTPTGKYLNVRCKNCGNNYRQPYLDAKERLKHFKDIPSTFTKKDYKEFFSKLGYGIGRSAIYHDIKVLEGLGKIQQIRHSSIDGGVDVYKKVELIEEGGGVVANAVLTQRKLNESVFRERTPF